MKMTESEQGKIQFGNNSRIGLYRFWKCLLINKLTK